MSYGSRKRPSLYGWSFFVEVSLRQRLVAQSLHLAPGGRTPCGPASNLPPQQPGDAAPPSFPEQQAISFPSAHSPQHAAEDLSPLTQALASLPPQQAISPFASLSEQQGVVSLASLDDAAWCMQARMPLCWSAWSADAILSQHGQAGFPSGAADFWSGGAAWFGVVD